MNRSSICFRDGDSQCDKEEELMWLGSGERCRAGQVILRET